MKRIECVTLVAATVLIGGCITSSEEPKDDGGDCEQDVAPVSQREAVDDDNFVLYFDEDPAKCTFHVKNEEATLADLANFAMQACWSQRLSKKFGNDGGREPLTDNDIKLVDFCLDVHLKFLDVLSYAMLHDLTLCDSSILQDYTTSQSQYKPPVLDLQLLDQGGANQGDEMDRAYEKMRTKFLISGKSPLRNAIAEWGIMFHFQEKPQKEHWAMIYGGIFGQRSDSDVNVVEKKSKEWLPANGGGTTDVAEKWAVMESLLRRYLVSLNGIYKTLEKTASNLSLSDRTSLEKLQGLVQQRGAAVHTYNRLFRGVLYDMPLAFYALRGYAGAYTNWHWYGDNEKEMYKAAKYMVVGIRGTEMIVNARSLYSIDAYNSTVSFLKSKLSADEYQTLLTQSKMYRVDITSEVDGANRFTEVTQK